MIPAKDGCFPYLTDFLLKKYFNPEEDRIKNNLVLGIAVKDTCIVATYGEKTKHKKRKRSEAKKENERKENDKDDSETANMKPTGYTFSAKPIQSIANLLPGIRTIAVPTFDLFDDIESENPGARPPVTVVSTNRHLSIYTPNGLQEISPQLYTETAINLKCESFVALFDQANEMNTKKRQISAMDRCKHWLDACIESRKMHLVDSKDTIPLLFAPLSCCTNKMLNIGLDQIEAVQDSIDGIALVSFHRQEEKDQKEALWQCAQRFHSKPKIVLATSSLRQVLIAAEGGANIIGSALPIIWGCSHKAFVFNHSGEDLDENRCFDVADAEKYTRDSSPLCNGCKCPACKDNRYSRAYIHHLIHAKEMLADILLVSHNLFQFIELIGSLNDAKQLGSEELAGLIKNIEK